MELIGNRKQAIPLMIDWVKSNLPLNQTVNFTRKEVSKTANVTEGVLSRVFLVLINHGYLSYRQRKDGNGIYLLLKDAAGLTNAQIEDWLKEYDKEKKQSRKDRLSETPSSQIQTEPYKTPSQEYQMTEEKPEPLFAPPKSRSQQLLEEAERLREEAEKEAQREAEEAQKATKAPESMPGTTPELLTMLDSRVDAIEGRINAVVSFFEQASIALRGLATVGPIASPATEATTEPLPAPEPTTRNLLVRLVNSYAAADRKSEHDTWKWLYGQFDLRKGFNVYAQAGPSAKGKDESYLTVIEQAGRMDELYDLAKKLMRLPELR